MQQLLKTKCKIQHLVLYFQEALVLSVMIEADTLFQPQKG